MMSVRSWKRVITRGINASLCHSSVHRLLFRPMTIASKGAISTTLRSTARLWFNGSLRARLKSYGTDMELSAVEKELKALDSGIAGIQMSLFQAVCKDVSDPTPGLIAKLNSEYEVSADDMHSLAMAVIKARKSVSEGTFLLSIATALMGCSGEMGNTDALYTYAQLLYRGEGVERDLTKAAELYEKLATKGHPFAQYCLGSMYYYGSGVEQNFKTAYSLFKVSSHNHVPQSFNMLGNLHRRGEGVDKDFKMAVECYQKGIEYGDLSAHINLAHSYSNGEGVEQSSEKAFEHYLIACKANDPIALYNVGVSYLSGNGAKQDFTKAKEYLEKSATLGFYPAQVNLGNMYYSGMGCKIDIAKAKELFRLAAQQDKGCAEYLQLIEEEEKKLQK